MIVERGRRMGLTVRGGSEFALGIFVSSVQQRSAASEAGVQVGLINVHDVN